MKRTWIMGLCLMAICAALGMLTTSAFAIENLPHWGKCEAQAGGKYTNSGCTKLPKTGEGKFEWHPLAAVVKFTSAKEKETGNAVLESANGTEISCSGQTEKQGEYGPTNHDVQNVIGEFSGCKALGGECSSEGAGKEKINTKKLDGEPGIVTKEAKEEKNLDGNDLRGEAAPNGTATLAEFSCSGAPVIVKGGVVVEASQDGVKVTNKMLNKLEVEFNAAKPGKQVPENWTPNFEGPSNTGTRHEINEHLEGSVAGGPFEPSGQTLTTVQSTVGKVKVELRQCEKTISCPN
jgi:hypothetical protein